MTNEQRITRFDRTQQFSIDDFHLLCRFVDGFETVFTTPHILAEVSNLARLKGTEHRLAREQLRVIIGSTTELFPESLVVSATEDFVRLGLTDAAIIVAAKQPFLTLTDDLDLYLTLGRAGLDAINFNHIRMWS